MAVNGIIKRKTKANAVFEGGGVKGIGIAGALAVASRYYDWVYVAGTSAGAIVASLVAAGYSPEEIRDLVFNIDYSAFEDRQGFPCIPLLAHLWGLKFNLGLYKGDYIEEWIKEKLKRKGIERFSDLVVKESAGKPQWRYRLRVIASDISDGKMLILPQDIARYGINPDDMEVATAIRMSISIPFFFEPVRVNYAGPEGEQMTNYIVDGGVLSNYPVWLFDRKPALMMPAIGFKLVGPDEERPNTIAGPVSMLKALFSTMLEAHDNRFIEEKNVARTIAIPTLDVRTTDFAISGDKIQELYESGYKAAEEFFGVWDYHAYLQKYADKL